MRDLEIRGAGNLLGAEQSGHMESVGYDLYCKMLNEAVLTMKGEQQEVDTFTTSIDLSIDATFRKPTSRANPKNSPGINESQLSRRRKNPRT